MFSHVLGAWASLAIDGRAADMCKRTTVTCTQERPYGDIVMTMDTNVSPSVSMPNSVRST